MPTIDQLAAAIATTTDDEVPVSQNGVLRRATIAQITAGLQPTLALGSGQVLGRISAGSGTPESIAIGANLSLSNGTLSATASQFNVANLPAANSPSAVDLIAMAQAGVNKSVPYGQFMAGLGGLPNIDLSTLQTKAQGATVARSLADHFSTSVAIEDFGAVGDGVTDDSDALTNALQSGRPVRLAAKTYVVNGQFTITANSAVLLGMPGQTILRRAHQTGGGAWIAIQGAAFRADGITFDANKTAIVTDSWNVLVGTNCATTDFHRCTFLNAFGTVLGNGLTILASDPLNCQHVVRDCEFSNNAVHGLWAQACAGLLIEGCRAHDNGQYGICLDYNDASYVKKVHLAQVLGNRCWSNQRGIAIGNYNATNLVPPTWGNANPDALSIVVASNICHDNLIYGISVSGRALLIHGNLLSNNGNVLNSGAGILANISYSRVTSNMVTGPGLYGIDCGGSLCSDISANQVQGSTFGINCGGGINIRVDGNYLQDCSSWAMVANNVETDAQGLSFGQATSVLSISGNWIALTSSLAGGILLRDGPQNVIVARNSLVGTNGGQLSNALWANTDSIIIEGNRWNLTQRCVVNPTAVSGLQTLLVPDIADNIMITTAPGGVQSMISMYQAQSAGGITFVRIQSPGTNYTNATISIGGLGAGASARTILSAGAIIGAVVTATGTGYGATGTQVSVTITGDGSGAVATAWSGLPVPEERRLLVRCNSAVKFSRIGSTPLQENWSYNDLNVPAAADVEWIGTWGTWRASRFATADYLAPDGAGGASLRSVANGDVQIHPNGSGRLRLTTDAEATGCLSAIGRGAPEGVVVAPPGSTYRNLNGGAGTSFYVKRAGNANTGWFALG